MSDLQARADATLELLMRRIPRILQRDAPESSSYALAVWFEWSRGDWFRWLPLFVVMQNRRLDAGRRLGVDGRVAFWDPWGVPAAEWAEASEIAHGTAGVVAGVAGDLSASPNAARVFEPLQDAWLEADADLTHGVIFEERFGIELAHRLDRLNWTEMLAHPSDEFVVYLWPDSGRQGPALAQSVSERHHPTLAAQGVWPP